MTFYKDPDCKITAPNHVCRRRDHQLLNGSNGTCYASARLESYQAHPASTSTLSLHADQLIDDLQHLTVGVEGLSHPTDQRTPDTQRSIVGGVSSMGDLAADVGQYVTLRCDRCGYPVVVPSEPGAVDLAVKAMTEHQAAHERVSGFLDELAKLTAPVGRLAEALQVLDRWETDDTYVETDGAAGLVRDLRAVLSIPGLDPNLAVHFTVEQAEKVQWLCARVIGYVCYQEPLADIEGRVEDVASDIKRLLDGILLSLLDKRQPSDLERMAARNAIRRAAEQRLTDRLMQGTESFDAEQQAVLAELLGGDDTSAAHAINDLEKNGAA